MFLKTPQRETADGETVDARAVKAAGRVFIVGLGTGAGRIGWADPHAETLPASVFEDHGIAGRRAAEQLDAVDGDGECIEVARSAFFVDAWQHLDAVTGEGAGERRADGAARVHNQRASRSRKGCNCEKERSS